MTGSGTSSIKKLGPEAVARGTVNALQAETERDSARLLQIREQVVERPQLGDGLRSAECQPCTVRTQFE